VRGGGGRTPARLWWAGALCAGLACDSPPAKGGVLQDRAFLPRVRDSAGVRLVEYPDLGPAPARSSTRAVNPLLPQLAQFRPVIQLESKPFLRLGGLHDREEDELDSRHSMLSVVELGSGILVVMDRTRLLYYDRNGALLHVAGRRGRGPGEFLQTASICALPGDTVMVIDFVDERITVWDGNARHLATHARPGAVVYGGCHPRGDVVVRDPGTFGTIRDTIDQLIQYRLVSPSGARSRPLGPHPAPVSGYPVPRPMLIHDGKRLIVGNGRTYEIRTYDTSARLLQVTRLLRHREVITDDDWEAQIRLAIPRNATPAQAGATRTRMSQQRPYRLPAFNNLRLDRQGRLWVSDYASEQGWTVFDSSGMIVGRFDVAGGPMTRVGIAGFGRDFVALRSMDSDHVVHLEFYRMLQ
jgi:hypothetical protein